MLLFFFQFPAEAHDIKAYGDYVRTKWNHHDCHKETQVSDVLQSNENQVCAADSKFEHPSDWVNIATSMKETICPKKKTNILIYTNASSDSQYKVCKNTEIATIDCVGIHSG